MTRYLSNSARQPAPGANHSGAQRRGAGTPWSGATGKHAARGLRWAPLFVLAMCSLLAAGCSDDDDKTVGPSGPARLEGLVFDEQAQPVSGASVTASRIAADGDLTVVSREPATTNVEGEYALELEVADVTHLVARAVKGGQEWKAVVSAPVRSGSTVRAQPLTAETTLEAATFQRVRAQASDTLITYPRISEIVNDVLAEAVEPVHANTVVLALALSEQVQAENLYLTDPSVGGNYADIRSIRDRRAAAQVGLETALDLAGDNNEAAEAAHASYHASVLKAFTDNGITAAEYGQAIAVGTAAFTRMAAALNADAELGAIKASALHRATALQLSISNAFSALEATDDKLEALSASGRTLAASVRSATSAQAVAAAWQDYHDEVLAHLRDVKADLSDPIGSVDATVRGIGGIRAVLVQALDQATSPDATVQAHVTYYHSVAAAVRAALTTSSDEEIETIAAVLALANLPL